MVLGKSFKVICMTACEHKATVVHSGLLVAGAYVNVGFITIPQIGCNVLFSLIKIKAVIGFPITAFFQPINN